MCPTNSKRRLFGWEMYICAHEYEGYAGRKVELIRRQPA